MFDPNDVETKAALKTAVEAAVAEATQGLVNKNTELIAKLKKATKDAAIDPADFQTLTQERDNLEAKLTETSKAFKSLQSQAEKDKKALETESSFVSRLLIDNGLNDAMTKVGVKPEMTKAVKAMLSGQVVIKMDGEKRSATVGDKSLSDFVAEWAKSDEGKHFVAAPGNAGGGAAGGAKAQEGKKTMTRTEFDALDAAQKVEFAKGGGTLT